MRTGKDSRLQRPPSLEPAVSRTASGGLSRNPDFQSKRNPPPFRRWMFSIFTNLPPVGTCVSSAGLSQDGEVSGAVTDLETNVDAGTEITVTRSSDGEQRVISLEDGALLGGGLPGDDTPPLYLEAGTFRLESDGGADVGAFGLDVDVPAPVVWTNRDDLARVSRSGFEVRWQGGNGRPDDRYPGSQLERYRAGRRQFCLHGRRHGRLVSGARLRACEHAQRAGLRGRLDYTAQPE